MRHFVPLLALACLTCWVDSEVLAMGQERFGNAPLHEANYQDLEGIMPLINDKARVYHSWVNGNENFYYRGDTTTLNQALQKFAAAQSDVRELVLRPAPGIVRSFNGARTMPFNWNLHIMGGIAGHMTTRDRGDRVWSKYPVLTAYVGGSIDLDEIKVPAGLTVLELADLSERCRQGLASTDKTVRGWSNGVLARLDPYDNRSMAAIAKLLEDDDDWVRLNAAGALAVFGKKAESMLPALWACLGTDDQQLKARVEETIEKIERAKDTATAEAEHREILNRIGQFRRSHAQRESGGGKGAAGLE